MLARARVLFTPRIAYSTPIAWLSLPKACFLTFVKHTSTLFFLFWGCVISLLRKGSHAFTQGFPPPPPPPPLCDLAFTQGFPQQSPPTHPPKGPPPPPKGPPTPPPTQGFPQQRVPPPPPHSVVPSIIYTLCVGKACKVRGKRSAGFLLSLNCCIGLNHCSTSPSGRQRELSYTRTS